MEILCDRLKDFFIMQSSNICEGQPPGGCKHGHGCQVNKLLIYVSIVSDHVKKCGCIQEWMIDGAGLLTSYSRSHEIDI
jgi:hypothetical protein